MFIVFDDFFIIVNGNFDVVGSVLEVRSVLFWLSSIIGIIPVVIVSKE